MKPSLIIINHCLLSRCHLNSLSCKLSTFPHSRQDLWDSLLGLSLARVLSFCHCSWQKRFPSSFRLVCLAGIVSFCHLRDSIKLLVRMVWGFLVIRLLKYADRSQPTPWHACFSWNNSVKSSRRLSSLRCNSHSPYLLRRSVWFKEV